MNEIWRTKAPIKAYNLVKKSRQSVNKYARYQFLK